MPRRARSEPHIRFDIEIPETLAAEIELLLLDPTTGKARYGARRKLIERLLRQWVNDQRKPQDVSR